MFHFLITTVYFSIFGCIPNSHRNIHASSLQSHPSLQSAKLQQLLSSVQEQNVILLRTSEKP